MSSFEELVAVMHRLRAPGGCPWDREQTFRTLRRYVIEESYEVVDAIDQLPATPEKLADELGDLLLQVVFLSEIAAETGLFAIDDVASTIRAKLVARHPHVFGDVTARTASDVVDNWEKIKASERAGAGATSALDGAGRSLPALMLAEKLGERASRAGFDWRCTSAVLDKIAEEIGELREATEAGDRAAAGRELGDLLFATAQAARFLDVHPEEAARESCRRFEARFRHMESALRAVSKIPTEVGDAELDRLWEAAKEASDGSASGVVATGLAIPGPATTSQIDVRAFEECIGVPFHDHALLARSLTHRSFANETGQPGSCNETLEFLGDALLGFLVAEIMTSKTTLRDEGEMTKVKSRLVSEPTLAQIARDIGIGAHLLLSKGEEKTGGRAKTSILADTYEAVLAAVYLDQGVDAARRFVARDFRSYLVELCQPGAAADPKSALQELCHQKGLPMPRYRVSEAEGPEHARTFVVLCEVASIVTSTGSGSSKKEAERLAAHQALDRLAERDPPILPEVRPR